MVERVAGRSRRYERLQNEEGASKGDEATIKFKVKTLDNDR